MAKKECLEWGFDLTDFSSARSWKNFLKRNGCKLAGTRKLYGDHAESAFGHKPDHYLWTCNGVGITTEHPGEPTKKRPDLDGAIGYVGVEFTKKSKAKWMDIRKDFVASADYIKEETRCQSGFIHTPSQARKMKPRK